MKFTENLTFSVEIIDENNTHAHDFANFQALILRFCDKSQHFKMFRINRTESVKSLASFTKGSLSWKIAGTSVLWQKENTSRNHDSFNAYDYDVMPQSRKY